MNNEIETLLSNIMSLVDEAQSILSAESMSPDSVEDQDQVTPDLAEKILNYLDETEGEEMPEEEKVFDEEIEEEDEYTAEDEILEEEEIEMAEDEDEEDEVDKSDEGPTASDDADERVNESGDVNEKNIQEVAKQITKLLFGIDKPATVRKSKKTVKKSMASNKLIKQLRNDNREMRKALEVMLKNPEAAQAFASQALAPKKEVTKTPQNDPNEIAKSIDWIKEQLGQPKEKKPEDPFSLRKSLVDDDAAALKGIFSTQRR